jgi:DNA-binding NtrC family response regulator
VKAIMLVIVLTPSSHRADFLRRLCGSAGFKFKWVTSLRDVGECLSANGSHVVVCDHKAPGYSWLDALALTRKSPGVSPLLVILSRFDAAGWVEVLRRGATEVVAEPLRAQSVLEALQNAARLSRASNGGLSHSEEYGERRWPQRLWAFLSGAARR